MQEDKRTGKAELFEEELGEVTGGTEWVKDPEESSAGVERTGFREKPGIGQTPDNPVAPVNGVMDRIALKIDRVRENITKAALRE